MIIRGAVVIILLLNGWANAKLAAASITTAIKHRAAIFILENTCSSHAVPAGAKKLFDLCENVFRRLVELPRTPGVGRGGIGVKSKHLILG
ncbi:MAG: hypothetical protein DMF24_11975 [Verrucomicrobia bacterium]|nr:MAG: hypothetical protein DMF24_11975 [Verrucomicrobiota bacterium]